MILLTVARHAEALAKAVAGTKNNHVVARFHF
jgi:hypothetical protein